MDGTSTQSRKAVVRLDGQQRLDLEQLTRNGVQSAKQILHARILLMSDAEHPLGRYTDEQISRHLHVSVRTIERVRGRFVTHGLTAALKRKQRAQPPVTPKLDGKAEAALVAICCSPPPAGRVRWTLSLLTDALKDREIVVSICKETVRKTLKKTSCSPGESSATAFPNRIVPAL